MPDICNFDFDNGGDGPKVYAECKRKARKPHKCYECGRIISTGESYLYVSGIWEDGPASFHFCSDCESIMRAFNYNGSFGNMDEEIRNSIFDVRGEVSPKCIVPLTERAKDRVCGWIDEILADLCEPTSEGEK